MLDWILKCNQSLKFYASCNLARVINKSSTIKLGEADMEIWCPLTRARTCGNSFYFAFDSSPIKWD